LKLVPVIAGLDIHCSRSLSMPDISPQRVALIAEAARIPIELASAERVARAVAMPVNRLTTAKLTLPLEIEPSSFAVIQQREIGR
jgi:hypothetical protein